MVSVIDTIEFRQWSANFPSQYHPTAELLVGALHYLDESTFRSNLTEQILHDFDSGLITPPALVVPVRTGPEMGHHGSELAVIFENVFPRQELPTPNTGSEALCANIIRNLGKGQEARLGMVRPPHTLEDFQSTEGSLDCSGQRLRRQRQPGDRSSQDLDEESLDSQLAFLPLD